VQEVFIKCYVNIQGFEVEKRFGSWVFRIAHNVAIDFIKKKKEVKISTNNEDFWDNVEDKRKLVEELVIEKEQTKQLVLALEKLEVKYREPILLYYFEDKSYDEIAEIIHTSVNNVGVLLMRAREKLKIDLRNKI
nr:RNA polymerase sigma factor [Candidatus Shapirobacteria bacterium]